MRVLVVFIVLLCLYEGLSYSKWYRYRITRTSQTTLSLELNHSESSSVLISDVTPNNHFKVRRDITARSDVKVSSNVTARSDVTGKSNVTVSSDVETVGDHGVSRLASKGLDPVGGAGRPLEAWGKVVKPRANVSAPWSRDNTSTLCPLVPPKLGEFGTFSFLFSPGVMHWKHSTQRKKTKKKKTTRDFSFFKNAKKANSIRIGYLSAEFQ